MMRREATRPSRPEGSLNVEIVAQKELEFQPVTLYSS